MRAILTHRRIPVLALTIDEDTSSIVRIDEIINPAHIPVGVPFVGGIPDRRALNDWWRGRAIPASRSGIREALDTSCIDVHSSCYSDRISQKVIMG